MDESPALFTEDGDWYVPSEFTRGPWRPDAQHGGPPSALLGHVIEPIIEPTEYLSHIEVELLRPVPLARLRAVVRRERVSGRVTRIHGELHSEKELVARANALVLVRAELAPRGWSPPHEPPIDPPEPGEPVEVGRFGSGERTAYHRNAVEHRLTSGSFKEAGPAVDWIRLRQPLIAGRETTGLERVLATADFGSGVSAVYESAAGFGLINANLTVAIHRPPQGEWISLDARTHAEGGTGTGLAITTLGDTAGAIGIATQSLLGYSFG